MIKDRFTQSNIVTYNNVTPDMCTNCYRMNNGNINVITVTDLVVYI